MSYCLNFACPDPENAGAGRFCQKCGKPLLLGDYPAGGTASHRLRAVKAIGQGGFGRTLLAIDETVSRSSSDPSALAQSEQPAFCVIKQLLSESRQSIDLFRQEAERLRLLGEHPQIPALLAHFEQEDALYLVQEFINGQTLEEVLNTEGTFSEAQVRSLLAEILPVLRFIHDRQIIHRDIKPSNIIRPHREPTHCESTHCESNADQKRLFLVDFGASKLSAEELKQTGTVIGSAGYAAPEQAMGKAEFSSDLYSLGVTCVHLLTGQHPFDLYSVSEDAWVWRSYLPKPISSELRRVLDKLLQRATRQRYRHASEVLRDLRLEASPAKSAATRTVQPNFSKRVTAKGRTASDRQQWNCVQMLEGHEGEITALAIDPTGNLLATGGSDRAIYLWDLATGKRLHSFLGRSFWSGIGHRDRITDLLFHPDRQTLISSSDDGTIHFWDLETLRLLDTLPGQGWGITALQLSHDGLILVSGDRDGLIQLWDLERWRMISQFQQQQGQISGFVLTPDERVLISSSDDKTLCFWDFETDELLKTVRGHADRISALALSPSGNTLISGSVDRSIKLWNRHSGEQVKVIAAHRAKVNDLQVHPKEPLFASGSEDSTIKVWDIRTGDRLATLSHPWGVNAIGFTPKGDLLVSGSADEVVRVWVRG